MTNTLVIPPNLYSQIFYELLRVQDSVVLGRLGISRTEDENLFLVRDAQPIASVRFVTTPAEPSLLATLDPHAPESGALLSVPPFLLGRLSVGTGPYRGCLWAAVRNGDAVEAVHRVALPGPGMHVIHLANGTPAMPPTAVELSRYSRTIGALGGEEAWERLRHLRVAINGCGRVGSLVAIDVARLGVLDTTLIDPDVVEIHNRCEMDAVKG